jgi:hypothetical protein
MDFAKFAKHKIDLDNVVTKKYGATTVYIVPPIVTEEEKANILKEYRKVGWEIIKDLAAKGEKL